MTALPSPSRADSPHTAGAEPAPATPIAPSDLVDILHARGQRATPQRLVVLRELRRLGRHSTAEEVRRVVRGDLPGTSTPTVYATLDLLVELGLARRVDVGGGPALYDPRTDPHQHTVCHGCGGIEDLDARVDLAGVAEACAGAGFDARAVDVVVAGLCARCRAK